MTQHNQQHQATAQAPAGRRLMPSSEFKRVVGDISEMTRWRLERAGTGPMPVRRGGRNYYFQDEVEAYLDELAAGRSPPEDKSTDTADNMEEHNGGTS